MNKFYVRIPVTLTIQVDAPDATTAVDSVERAFMREKPLPNPIVTIVPRSSLEPLCHAAIIEVLVTGPAFQVEANSSPA